MNNSFFPYSEVRDEQQRIIDTINKNLSKRYFIIEAGTGVGKSGIAVEAGLSDGKGYIVTDSIQLQNQYNADFSAYLKNMMGKSNYRCFVKPSLTCATGPCTYSENGMKQAMSCYKMGHCPYKTAKDEANNSPLFLTNYAYLIATARHDPKFQKRNTIIFDEAHLLEKHLTEQCTIDINIDKLDQTFDIMKSALPQELEILKTPLKKLNGAYQQFIDTLSDVCNRQLEQEEKQMKIITATLFEDRDEKDDVLNSLVSESSQRFYDFQNLCGNLDTYKMSDRDDWIESLNETIDSKTQEPVVTLQIRPLKIDWVYKQYLDTAATDHVYFLSATILDADLFCETLGLDKDNVCFIREDSTFDSDMSPIYNIGNCKTNYAALQDTANMDTIVETVDMIMQIYPNSKGIIHSGNKKISNYLKNKLKSSRLLVNDGTFNNRDIYEKHISSDQPTVLVSSSMAEGVDLKDDLSRFQIVIKMPFDSLADPRIKKLTEMNSNWYSCEMMKKFIQQCGRSTRNKEDHCDTFVLDSLFWKYIKTAKDKNWLPQQFLNRCRNMDGSKPNF